MKKIIWLNFYLFLISANAQIFAPIGATWRYITPAQNAPDSIQCRNYAQFEAIKDTVINSINAVKISKIEIKNRVEYGKSQHEYFYQSGKKIYFLNRVSGEFHLLFDFEAKIGDTIKVFNNQSFQYPFDNQTICGLKYFIYKIESVEIVTISGQSLIKQKVATICPTEGLEIIPSCNLCWGFSYSGTQIESEIIEKVGAVQNFYSFLGNPNGVSLLATGYTGMIYYQDESTDYFKNKNNFCKVITSNLDRFQDDNVKILFEKDVIKIFGKDNQLGFDFRIFDVLGNSYLFTYEDISQNEIVISTSKLQSGIYILKFYSNSKLKTLKFNKL